MPQWPQITRPSVGKCRIEMEFPTSPHRVSQGPKYLAGYKGEPLAISVLLVNDHEHSFNHQLTTMYSSFSRLVSVFTVLTHCFLAAVAQPSMSNNSTPSLAASALTGNTLCHAKGTSIVKTINIADCFTALRQLPNTYSAGFYGPQSYFGEFQLPQSRTSASCKVSIALRPGYQQEESSWVVVRIGASELIWACTHPGSQPLLYTMGGATTTGRRDGIQITIAPADIRDIAGQ